jgi:hypothetical protein
VMTSEGDVLLWLFSQKMYIFVAWHKPLLDVSGILLAVENGYNSNGCWYLEAEVTRVEGSFKRVQDNSSKCGIIRVEHIDDVKGYVFSERVLGVLKDTDKVMTPTGSICFPLKS